MKNNDNLIPPTCKPRISYKTSIDSLKIKILWDGKTAEITPPKSVYTRIPRKLKKKFKSMKKDLLILIRKSIDERLQTLTNEWRSQCQES